MSSSLSWHNVHFSVAVAVGVAATLSPLVVSDSLAAPFIAPASLDVTVVEETCLEPDDLLPLEDPAVEFGECWEPREADRGATLVGGLPPADRGLPGGRLSATDMRAAIGLCPEPAVGWLCWVVPAALASGGEPVRLVRGELELVPLALATDTGAFGLNAVPASKEAVLMGCFSCLNVLSVETTNDCAKETAGRDSPLVSGGLTALLCSSTDIILLAPVTSPLE